MSGWVHSSVRAILKNSMYRGRREWGKTRKRDATGQVAQKRQPSSGWTRADAPELRIVDEKIAAAVDARFEAIKKNTLRASDGKLMGRPRGEGFKYILTGLLSCGVCDKGGLEVLSSASGGKRNFHYRCYVARRMGPAKCANTLPARMEDADAAVIHVVKDTLLNPAVVERALAHAEAAIARGRSAGSIEAMEDELNDVEKVIQRLTKAIAIGKGELEPLVAAVENYEQRRKAIEARLAELREPPLDLDAPALRRKLRGYLSDYQGLLHGHVSQAQQILRRLVKGRLVFTPTSDGDYRFEGVGTVQPIIAGIVRKPANTAWSVPNGIRTRVLALKGPRPRPLDDGDPER
jgi:hypothetical protein